jgi:hypothetical protein
MDDPYNFIKLHKLDGSKPHERYFDQWKNNPSLVVYNTVTLADSNGCGYSTKRHGLG